jgi:lactoylglutathione lyase
MSLHHAAMAISDLDASMEFYCDFLGCEVAREDVTDEGVRNVHLGWDGGRDFQFKYDPDGGPVEPQGIHHFAVYVDSVDEFTDQLDADRITRAPEDIEDLGVRIAFITDPDGYVIELMEEI